MGPFKAAAVKLIVDEKYKLQENDEYGYTTDVTICG
jgi:hypothetical protein